MTTSLVQRREGRSVVTSVESTALSRSARAATRSVERPSSSPISRLPGRPRGTARRMRAGSTSSAAMPATTMPTVRSGPATAAMVGSLIPFWADAMTPSGPRWGSTSSAAQRVS
ncbi:hypothetical protein TSH58_01965 [Azospirillum sp. TSH58]|nr:hypothetical protein TSH58_01965 [Azospirillum sp. TSH58]